MLYSALFGFPHRQTTLRPSLLLFEQFQRQWAHDTSTGIVIRVDVLSPEVTVSTVTHYHSSSDYHLQYIHTRNLSQGHHNGKSQHQRPSHYKDPSISILRRYRDYDYFSNKVTTATIRSIHNNTFSPRYHSTSTSAIDRTSSSDDYNRTTIHDGYVTTAKTMSSLLWNPTMEHSLLRESIRTFVQDHVESQANAYNQREEFNIALFKQLGITNDNRGLGILGLSIDEEYGGCNMDATALVLVHEELSYSDPAFCLSYLAHSILCGHNLFMNSTSEGQKQLYLPSICSGSMIGGMAMSEVNAGTDVLGMQTKATYDPDMDGYILNGTKMWITNGTIDNGNSTGDIFLVYARTGTKKFDISLFIVTKGMEGFTLGQPIKNKCGMRASNTAELIFDNVFVPTANVVGTINSATMCMMRNLEIERIALAAMSIGIARRCIDVMISYASTRSTFGSTNLMEYGQIQQMIATSYAEYMAGRSYVYATANTMQYHTSHNTLNADGTKLFCSQMATKVADRAIQVLGGNGYIGDYCVERLWRDSKLLQIGGGTNESHHKNMIRSIIKQQYPKME